MCVNFALCFLLYIYIYITTVIGLVYPDLWESKSHDTMVTPIKSNYNNPNCTPKLVDCLSIIDPYSIITLYTYITKLGYVVIYIYIYIQPACPSAPSAPAPRQLAAWLRHGTSPSAACLEVEDTRHGPRFI